MAVSNNMSAYGSLIKSFLALSAPDQPPLSEEPGPLQFTVEGQICTVFALHEQGKLILQSQAMSLAGLDPARVSAASRLLHTLNWTTAIGSGIVALIDDEEQVLVANRLDLSLLDASQLAERMAELLEAGRRLRQILEALPEADALSSARGPANERVARQSPPIDIQLV